MKTEALATAITQAIVSELKCRSMFNGIDEDIKDEISLNLNDIVLNIINNFDK